MKVSTRKRIVGIRNGLCSYIEIVGPVNAKYTIRCNFTKEQVNKLVTAMRNNDGDAAWTEYLNNKKYVRQKLLMGIKHILCIYPLEPMCYAS